jgi:hypothetical protein
MEIEKSRKDKTFRDFSFPISACNRTSFGGGHDHHPDHPEHRLLNLQLYNGEQHGISHQNQRLP